MTQINQIISEEINKFVNNIILEKKSSKKTSKKSSKRTRKKGYKKNTDANLNTQDNANMSNFLDSDAINLSAIAQEIYPDHTPEGAQSQLRKKVKHIKSDSGSEYKIKDKEAEKINKVLSKFGL